MKNFSLPTFSALMASLILASSGMSQEPPLSATIGRPLEAAPLEPAKSGEVPDAIAEIPDVDDIDSMNLDPEKSQESRDWAFVAVFEGPCHFSDRLNDVARSLVIYEGMQVAVDKSGNYQVSLNAEVPLTPVVMRLQLRVTELVGTERFDHGTITLPPIVMETSQETTDQQPSNTVRIRRTGYSHLLQRLMKNDRNAPGDLAISRSGVARFGGIPEAASYPVFETSDSNTGR